MPSVSPNREAAAHEQHHSEGRDTTMSSSQYPYPTHDDVLHHPYLLLSTKPRAPNACLMSRHAERRDICDPGPGEYDPVPMRPSTHGIKLSSARTVRLTDREAIDVPYYSPRMPSGRSALILHSRTEPKARPDQPGPGAYPVTGTFKTQKISHMCTFGAPHTTPRPPRVPGPGTYEHDPVDAKHRRRRIIGGGTAPAVTKKLRPIPTDAVPGPGSYDLGSTFTPKHGACFPTIKGRLAHPMDDRNAAHESAKTSTPRDGARRMKAGPRGY